MSKPTNRSYKDLSPCRCTRNALLGALYVTGAFAVVYVAFFGAHILALWLGAH